jgi:hypothetical protein
MRWKLKNSIRLLSKTNFSSANFEDNRDTNRAWDTIGENIRISAKESISHCESKHNKPWYDEKCSELFEGSRLNYSGCRTQMK